MSCGELRIADSRLLPPSSIQDPTKEGSFNATKLKAALPFAERARIASNLRVIDELHVRLNAVGWLQYDTLADGLSPMHLLYYRKEMHDVAPLAAAVEAAQRIKKEGDM